MNESRLVDANVNRAAEGMRVLEDVARFRFDNRRLSSQFRNMRHEIRDFFRERHRTLLASRDSVNDVGKLTSMFQISDTREDIKDTVISCFKRVQESFRALEEILKAEGLYDAGKKIEQMRFDVYSLEPEMVSLFSRRLGHGIYAILGEKFSCGRTNVQVAQKLAKAGVDIIQYREKLTDKTLRQILRECREIRKITADAGITFIVNDHVHIALMVEADGIHQGQDDLPVKEVRKIAPDMMIGCSTHSPEQAEKAVRDGADYIGVGPIFPTRTKEDVCDAVGLEYLDHVVSNHAVPFVAIGGIKRHNLRQVLAHGARTVCLVTEIIGAPDIEKTVQEIKNITGEYE